MNELVDSVTKNPTKIQIHNDGLTAEVSLTPADRLLGQDKKSSEGNGWAVRNLVDVIQGVTWGGEGCEEIFVSKVKPDIEDRLLYKTVGGRDFSSDGIKWQGAYLIFPYLRNAKDWEPVFGDFLDLSQSIDLEEQRLIGNPLDMVRHRIARHIGNLERFPKTAQYLVSYYERLREREFEGKNITEWGKAWYEYHRPRTPRLMTVPKMLCPRLMHEPCFAVDDVGYLPRDSVVALIPRPIVQGMPNSFKPLGAISRL